MGVMKGNAIAFLRKKKRNSHQDLAGGIAPLRHTNRCSNSTPSMEGKYPRTIRGFGSRRSA